VAELVQHDDVAVDRALAVELGDVEGHAEPVGAGLRHAHDRGPERRGVDRHEAVDLGDQALCLGAGGRDRLLDPGAIAGGDGRVPRQAGRALLAADRDRVAVRVQPHAAADAGGRRVMTGEAGDREGGDEHEGEDEPARLDGHVQATSAGGGAPLSRSVRRRILERQHAVEAGGREDALDVVGAA
jgi:hypothetical protein